MRSLAIEAPKPSIAVRSPGRAPDCVRSSGACYLILGGPLKDAGPVLSMSDLGVVFWHRVHMPFGWADSAWTAEDWTSNKLGAFFGRELRRAKIRQPITIANAFASLLNACNAVPKNAETTQILKDEATAWSRIPARQDNGNFINSIIWSNIGGVLPIRPQVGKAYRKLCFEKEKEGTMDDRDRGRIPRSWVGRW